MVSKGQFLERPTVIPVAGVVMEGVSHRGAAAPLLLILPPTPLEGGGMDHTLGAELAWAVSQAGHPTLRFNYRGVGASQGAVSAGPALLEDARAALEVARDNAGGGLVALASIGASALVALALAAEPAAEVVGVFSICPPPSARSALSAAAVPLAVLVGELDTRLPRPGLPVEVVPGADAAFHRNLPEVGRAAVRFLGRVRRTA